MEGRSVGGKAEKVGPCQSVDFGIRSEKSIAEDFQHYSLSYVCSL